MSVDQLDISYDRYHDAWRSVRMFEPESTVDERINTTFTELSKEDQALCIVTGMRVEDSILRHLKNDGIVDQVFVRTTMEEIYDAYNRYTIAMHGIQKYGLEWFELNTEKGPISPGLVPPYNSLSFTAKEIDRRMVMVGALGLAGQVSQTPELELAQRDGQAVLEAVRLGIPYDTSLAYAIGASHE